MDRMGPIQNHHTQAENRLGGKRGPWAKSGHGHSKSCSEDLSQHMGKHLGILTSSVNKAYKCVHRGGF